MSEHKDMNGLWSGRYFYNFSESAVSFTAWFDDTEGVLSGSTFEDNTFAPGAPDELAATLTGLRHGNEIEFSKLYDPATGILQPPLMYLGAVNASFTTAKGHWRFASAADHAGHFELSRISSGAKMGVERKVEVPVVVTSSPTLPSTRST
jgi:hypothetical protein